MTGRRCGCDERLFCVDAMVLVHLCAQFAWLAHTVRGDDAYVAMLFAAMLKSALLLQAGTVVARRWHFAAHVAFDAAFCVFLFVDYRLERVVGVHVLSPIVLSMWHVPANSMRNDWNTDCGELAAHAACMFALAACVVASVDLALNELLFVRLRLRAAVDAVRARRAMRVATYCATVVCGATLFSAAFAVDGPYGTLDVTAAATAAAAATASMRGSRRGGDWCNFDAPAMRMSARPNIVIAVYDSGRADMFNDRVFPGVHAAARTLGAHRCQKWPHHYSNGVQSDGGHVALAYATVTTRQRMRELEDAHAPSVPLEVLRANGYRVYGVSSGTFEYCWALGENCTTHRRIFDELHTPPADADYGVAQKDEWTATRAAALLKTMPEPYALFVYLDSTHYPYFSAPRYERHVPAAGIGDIWAFMATGSDEASAKEGVQNRYRNAATYVDALVAEHLLAPLAAPIGDGRAIFMLTSDHGEFLLDRGQRIGHTVNEYYEEQTHVSALFCAGGGVLRHIDADVVSGHVDVLPTILHIGGVHLPEDASLLPGRSLYRPGTGDGGSGGNSASGNDATPWAFSTYPWSRTVLLTDGTVKVWTDTRTVSTLTDMDDRPLAREPRYLERVDDLHARWQAAQALPLPCLADGKRRRAGVDDAPVHMVWLGSLPAAAADAAIDADGADTVADLCVDRKTPGNGGLHVYQCWADGWNQQWRYDRVSGLVTMRVPNDGDNGASGSSTHVLAATDGGDAVTQPWPRPQEREAAQKDALPLMQHRSNDDHAAAATAAAVAWRYDADTRLLTTNDGATCLDVDVQTRNVVVGACASPPRASQQWRFTALTI